MQDITVYTTTYCPYCQSAKRLLKSLNLDYREVGLDNEPELRQKLSQENNGWRTVPMIFVGKKFVGGFQELSTLHAQGKLLPLVQES